MVKDYSVTLLPNHYIVYVHDPFLIYFAYKFMKWAMLSS